MASATRRDPARDKRVQEILQAIIEETGGQAQAARALGVQQAHVSYVSSGQRGAGMKLLAALSKYTGKSIDEIVGATADEPAPPPEFQTAAREVFGADVPRWIQVAGASRANLGGVTPTADDWVRWIRMLAANYEHGLPTSQVPLLPPAAVEFQAKRKRGKR